MTPSSADNYSAWNPGVGTEVPHEFRLLETIFRPECVSSRFEEIRELAGLTGLAHEELTVFRPQRLALHELIIRVTADIAVAEGEEEEVFGLNFRRITNKIRLRYIDPHMATIERTYLDLRQRADSVIRNILAETLFPPPVKPTPRPFPLNLLFKPKAPPVPSESVAEREYRMVVSYKTAGLAADDPEQRAIFRSLYRVLSAIIATRGRVGSDLDLLATLACNDVCNSYGSRLVGQLIAPLVDAAIMESGYARARNREKPVLISLKGASASGKSSLRGMIKQIMHEQGIAADGYATISPDVWRRLLLDYESLGPASKFAGHLTGRELRVVDAKLDSHIRFKAGREHGIPHLLVDRFRFDSFSSEPVTRLLHDTYARYVDTVIMYFIVTPPEATVERGWQRGLERGRFKAVEDFLGHSVEAYEGMPKLLFKWLAHERPEFRYFFLDNSGPKGTFPETIAFGDQQQMTLIDPLAFTEIERYQKIDVNACSRDEVYPPAQGLAATPNTGFLKECIRRIAVVTLVDRDSGTAYLRSRNGVFEILDRAVLIEVLNDKGIAAILDAIAPGAVAVTDR